MISSAAVTAARVGFCTVSKSGAGVVFCLDFQRMKKERPGPKKNTRHDGRVSLSEDSRDSG
jgi:hypothetical protein